jgi:hypothetical protein
MSYAPEGAKGNIKEKGNTIKINLKHFSNIVNASTPLTSERFKTKYENRFSN